MTSGRRQLKRADLIEKWADAVRGAYQVQGTLTAEISAAVVMAAGAEWAALRAIEAQHGHMLLRTTINEELER